MPGATRGENGLMTTMAVGGARGCSVCGGSLRDHSVAYSECTQCDFLVSKAQAAPYDETYYYTRCREKDRRKRAELLMATFLEHLAGGKGLDFGCNDGAFVRLANRAGLDFVGADLNRSVVDRLKREEDGGRGRFFYPGELRERYDCLTAFDVVEHFDEPGEFLHQADALLKPGGVLLLTTPNRHSKWERLFGQGWHGYGIPEYHRCIFSSESLRKLLTMSGFSVDRCFTTPPLNRRGWRLLVGSGYRLKTTRARKLVALPLSLGRFLQGKVAQEGEEDTVCIAARKATA